MPTSHQPAGACSERRQLTILCADLHGFGDWLRLLGDAAASREAASLLALQEIIVTRDAAGQLLPSGPQSFCAVFDKPSDALNRALEIQRVLDAGPAQETDPTRPRARIGLHQGEVMFQEGDRVELVSRHRLRAQRMMEAAGPGQIFASEAVVEAGRDFIELPKEALAIRNYGEYYLADAGATQLFEVADLRFTQPEPPRIPERLKSEAALAGRLDAAGYNDLLRLGEGVNGVVYRATERATSRPVVIKVFTASLAELPVVREELTRIWARLRGLAVPGVADIRDACLDGHPAFVVSESVAGRPVDRELVGAPPERIARVFRAVCDVLARVHAAGLVHGDLKPGNVLVRTDDSVVLTDWGLEALRGRAGTLPVTAIDAMAYCSPEMIEGKAATPASDLYSLGAILFKVLCGREPFPGRTVHEVVQAQCHTDPPLPAALNPAVPDPLQRICLKALEKSPAERYAAAAEMAADLERYLNGALVRTRPTAYDNLLFHRVRRHTDQVREWSAGGLLSPEETHRLLAGYESLQRRGIPAVMESRVYRLWQTLVYLGGWAVVNGALLWLVLHWDTLSRVAKLLLGSVPALTALGLAWAMARRERFRLMFLALVVGVAAVPLLAGVWIYEFGLGAGVPSTGLSQELFHAPDRAVWFTNLQLFLTLLVTFLTAASVMLYTRTTTHSTEALAAFVLLYAAELLFFDLKPHWEAGNWATLSLLTAPLLLATVGATAWLVHQPDRPHQALPWILFSALWFIVVTGSLALYGPREWTAWNERILAPASFLLVSAAGVVQTGLGVIARNALQHRGRLAAWLLVISGLLSVLGGLTLAGLAEHWPEAWWKPMIFGQPVPAAHLALPLVSLAIALLACRFQMFTFLGLGLAGFAASVHLLGDLYFTQIAGWPQAIMILGAVVFFAALWMELRRTHGNWVGRDHQRL